MEDLDAGMARLQQMHFVASRATSVAGPPPGLHPEQAHVIPPRFLLLLHLQRFTLQMLVGTPT